MENYVSKRKRIILIALMCVIGTCMHFVCDIFKNDTAVKVLGLVFPVNETSWEHMKMIWFPFLVAGIILSAKYKKKGYFSAFVVCGLAAMFIQLGLFSLYQSITGTSVLILDIIFYMADMILMAMLALKLSGEKWADGLFRLFIIVAAAVTAGIIYLTYCPGNGYVFKDDSMF